LRFSYGLPTHRVDRPAEFLEPGTVGELAAAAERAGFDAVHTTDHPFPPDDWVRRGGHHALDPFVALSFAAAATTRVRLHTHLLVAAYRNPFVAAKGIATLDVLSGGRMIVGLGAGYLEREFEALGIPFSQRNQRMDETVSAMRSAWTGTATDFGGEFFRATGNAMLPRPAQRPHPPLWIGGNGRRAIRRAVTIGDGWCPFPAPARLATHIRTVPMETTEALAQGIDYAREVAAEVGRQAPLTLCFIPEGLSMGADQPVDVERVLHSVGELAALGVDWVTVALAGDTRDAQLAAIEAFGRDVVATADG
jgi:probable F420-dependent oxidoreductase